MGGKGGSSDPSGMYAALASVQAANQAYQYAGQELDWAKQQWGQEWPYMQQAAQTEVQSAQQTADFSRNQQQFYEQQYQPMETAYNKMATQWASPQNIALQSGQASANVAESINTQKQAAQTQLEGYGVNPGSTRFASLSSAMGVQGGAAEAGAGTAAAMATKMQGMQLVGGAVNTGRGFPNAVSGLTGASTGAGAAASSGLSQGLTAGAGAMTAGASLYGAGAQNMGVYTGAVNGYNQTQVGFAQANAMELAGVGSAAGSLFGAAMFHPWTAEKGGPVEYQGGGDVSSGTPTATTGGYDTGFNPSLAGSEGIGGGFAQGMNTDITAMRSARMVQMAKTLKSQSSSSPTAYQFGGDAGESSPIGVIPGRYFQAGPAIQRPQPGQPANTNQPPPIPPQNGTPGGIITPQMSPSKGQVPDDVDAKLTVGEFVMPLDVVRWRGKEYFYKQIDSARKQEMVANSRGDIGGEPTTAMPSRNPQFVSRPNALPPNVPQQAPQQAPQGAIPSRTVA